MPVKRKSSRNVSKLSRNNNINQMRPKRSKRSKRSKRASQKKRGRRASKRQRGGWPACRCDQGPCKTHILSGVFGESLGVRKTTKGPCVCQQDDSRPCRVWGD